MRFDCGEMRKLTLGNGLAAHRPGTSRPAGPASRAAARGPWSAASGPPDLRCGRGRDIVGDRHAIAGMQRPAVEAAHAADQVRGAAAEHRRRSGCRRRPPDRRARPATMRPNLRRCPRVTANDAPSATGRSSHVTSNCAPAIAIVVSASTISSGPISVISSVAASSVVADQLIREAMRKRIHRPGHRHAGRLVAVAAEVLHRGQQARLDDHAARRRHRSSRPARTAPGRRRRAGSADRDRRRTSPWRCVRSTASRPGSRPDTRRSAIRRCRPSRPARARAARDGAARRSTDRRGPCRRSPGTNPSM